MMKSLAFATYWLMVVAVVGGLQSQHSEYRIEDSGRMSPVLAVHDYCHATHHTNGRIVVADAECFSKLRKSR